MVGKTLLQNHILKIASFLTTATTRNVVGPQCYPLTQGLSSFLVQRSSSLSQVFHQLDIKRTIRVMQYANVILKAGHFLLGKFCQDPGEITHGNRTYTSFQVGKYITYWCFPGYNMTGEARMTCEEDRSTGHPRWSSTKPICQGQ